MTTPAPCRSYDERPLFDKLRHSLSPQAIDEALAATDTQSERERRLPRSSVVLLLVAAALFRHIALGQLVLLLRLHGLRAT